MIDEQYTVCTRCMTYNQESYILDAIKGFVMQETSFPVVSVIVDDASTDNEPQVILGYFNEHFEINDSSVAYQEETDYGKIYYARHKINKNCYFAIMILKENHYSKKKKKSQYYSRWTDNSKYIALCEGDDYWTDPHKLQKQVDFLEAHKDYSMCFHSASIRNETERKILLNCESIQEREYLPSDVFPNWVVPTASIVYRQKEVLGYPLKHREWFCPGDIVLILRCMHVGRVWGMSEQMSVYRMNNESVTAQTTKFDFSERMSRHYEALMINFPEVDREFCNRYISSFHYTRFRKEKNLDKKIKHLKTAIRFSPRYVFHKLLRIS